MKPRSLKSLMLFLLLLGQTAALSTMAACAPSAPGWVGWWRGDGTHDLSGTVAGAFRAGGKFGAGYMGSGFAFGGNHDALTLPATFQLSSQEFTVEAWIKRADPVRAGLPFLAGELFAGSANGFSFGLTDAGQLYLSHVGVANFYSTTAIQDLNWHHVAVTREGGMLRFYKDGVLASAIPCAVNFNLSGPYAIGGLGTPFDGISYGFLGSIDELAVYGRALTQAELAAGFANGSSGECNGGTPECVAPPPGLAGWWRGDGTQDVADATHGTFRSGGKNGPGFVGPGFVFGGNNDALALPATFRLASQEFTVEAWIQRADPVHAGLPILAGEFFAGSANGFSFGLTDGGQLYLSHIGVENFYSTTAIQDSAWHHVAVTREGGSLRFYADGALATLVPCAVMFDLNGPYAIGGLGSPFDGISYGFLGGIDELGVYERALTQPELAAIYQARNAGKCESGSGCTPPPDGLIGWYRAEETAEDWSRQNPGTFSTPRYAEGKTGKAFEFDGANDVVVPDGTSFGVSALTVEAWIFPTSLDGDIDVILSKELNNSDGIAFELGIRGPLSPDANTIATGNLTFQLGGVTGQSSDSAGWTDGGAAAPLNAWSHVALTYEPGQVRVYFNGVIVRSFSGLGGALRQTTGPLRLGSRSDIGVQANPGSRFNGRIDEVGLYNRALRAYEVSAVYHADSYGKCSESAAVTFSPPPASQNAIAGSDVTFSAGASGTRPMRYQWKFNDADIPNATSAQLLLPGVRKAAAGQYRVSVCNPAGCVTSEPATLTVTPARAAVYVVNTSTKSPQTVAAPVVLVGNGDENAVSFSLRFDPNRLTFVEVAPGTEAAAAQVLVNSEPAGQGLVGVAIALPAGAKFPEGTNELVQVTFRTAVIAADRTAPVVFDDNPTARRMVDATVGTLPATWTGGRVTIQAADFEGDVSPRPNGDKFVDISDWVQVGRIVAGLDEAASGLEFQRVDCAPRSTSGNGVLSVSDWVQTGRYAVGLDPVVPAAGPESAGPPPNRNRPLPQAPPPERIISLDGGDILPGQTTDVAVVLDALGDENALAFSLHYDPNLLRYVGAGAGSQSQGAVLNVNARDAAQGHLGLALALTTGGKFSSGQHEVAKLQFTAADGAEGTAAVAFEDVPVLREVASPLAETLPSGWRYATLKVIAPVLSIRLTQAPSGPSVVLSWPVQLTGATLESASDSILADWNAVPETPVTQDGANTITLSPNPAAAYFRLSILTPRKFRDSQAAPMPTKRRAVQQPGDVPRSIPNRAH